MSQNITNVNYDDYRFESISDFKMSAFFGGEIEFEWNGNSFGAFKGMRKTSDSPEQFLIGPSDSTEKQFPGKYTNCYYDTIDELLEYVIDGQRLRDIITQVTVTYRNL